MKKEPIRQCVGCGEAKPKAALVRIVKAPDATVFLDRSGKANGRGAYICKSTACLKKARLKKRLESSLECEIPDEVYALMEEELLRDRE